MSSQEMLISWQALKMTFAVLPGISLVIWAGYTGWSGKYPCIRDLKGIMAEINNAKSDGLKEFARTFVPFWPFSGTPFSWLCCT